jgi:AcrR family transcriptional regulator
MVNIDTSTQERILQAARNIFFQKGLSGARMQDIADEAGINKALLHYYFKSKDKLYELIFEEALKNFFPAIIHIVESDSSLSVKIEKFCTAYISMLQENYYLPLFVINEVNGQTDYFKEKYWQNKDQFFKKFSKQIETENKKGSIKAIKPEQLLVNMISMCIFPFLSKPILMMSTGMTDKQFTLFIEERKTAVPQFIIQSIKK